MGYPYYLSIISLVSVIPKGNGITKVHPSHNPNSIVLLKPIFHGPISN